jgi:hypothetical protein
LAAQNISNIFVISCKPLVKRLTHIKATHFLLSSGTLIFIFFGAIIQIRYADNIVMGICL